MANLSARKADFSKFQELNVQNLGISSDNPFAQKTFADSLKLPYPLLSDFPALKTIKGYGVLNESTQMSARRSFFLVDLQGILRQRWLVEQSQVFPSEPLLTAIRALAGKS